MTKSAPAHSSQIVTLDGERYIRIEQTEYMEPFLISVVSDSNLWMWVSSTGALTAGRESANGALFPYLTDDRIHRIAGRSGPVTVIRNAQSQEVWRPYGALLDAACTRTIYKHIAGNRIIFEERKEDWGMLFRYSWAPSAVYGWVRDVALINESASQVSVEITDGLVDIMPAGLTRNIETALSNLADAYKRAERYKDRNIALYTLQSLITDRPEPAESLTATVVWSVADQFTHLYLDERILYPYAQPERYASDIVVGRQCSFLHRGTIDIAPRSSSEWSMVIDTDINHAQWEERIASIGSAEARAAAHADIAAGKEKLESYLRDADGMQSTANATADAHHYSNVLFNCMRGGIFPHGYTIVIAEFLRALHRRNRALYDQFHSAIEKRGPTCSIHALHESIRQLNDTNLTRLTYQYLPVTFSRRHGDPSRPWNAFSINITDDEGRELLAYEGNWRDIFQNWEALLYSFPYYISHVVTIFLNYSTIDGYNPYRVTQDGVGWEVPDLSDPWKHIGYWGDHQIIYLLKLLELWQEIDSDALAAMLDQQMFSFVDTPYILAPHAEMVDDPHNTITFDAQTMARINQRIKDIGMDGQCAVDGQGNIIFVSMAEKLLIPALAKISAFVPYGGIWMNTQRPEWNDANNALAGYGLSMVTLYHLYRYIMFLRTTLFADSDATYMVRGTVIEWLRGQMAVLKEYAPHIQSLADDDKKRRSFLDAIADTAEKYRSMVYTAIDPTRDTLRAADIQEWCAILTTYFEAIIDAAQTADNLYHAYNVIHFTSHGAGVAHLPVMLEGQVAALSSGALTSADACELIKALYASELYQKKNNSFILYPANIPPSFIATNRIPADDLKDAPHRREAIDACPSLFIRGTGGSYHFAPHLKNAAVLRGELENNAVSPQTTQEILTLYEETFHHHSFTGRSGSMFGYEGIGSIYWHMVGKLQIAAQERYWNAIDGGDPQHVIDALRQYYHKIRAGLCFQKSAAEYGAFPTDCYSHTPAHGGAQQPGMTGQVKEAIISRYGELGLRIKNGVILLQSGLLPEGEYYARPDDNAPMRYTCTLCGVPFTIYKGDPITRITLHDGSITELRGTTIPTEFTHHIFARTGHVVAVTMFTQ